MRISDWSSDVCSSDLVARHALELDHLGPDFDVLAKQPQVPLASRQDRTAGAACLEAAEDDCVLRIRSEADDVVHDAPTGKHAARGNDDHRAMAAIEFLRFLDRSHPLRQIAHPRAVLAADIVLVVMVVVDLLGGMSGGARCRERGVRYGW